MITIDNCTLFSADCLYPEKAIKVLESYKKYFSFKEVILFTSEKFKLNFDNIVNIPHISNIEEYSSFMLFDLNRYIKTEFAFCVQYDSCLVNPELWSNDFLQSDFIGGPVKINGVGHFNGGVSIRSKKLMSIIERTTKPKQIPPEDLYITRCLGRMLKYRGIKFADFDVAKKFSFSSLDKSAKIPDGVFAAHGKFLL